MRFVEAVSSSTPSTSAGISPGFLVTCAKDTFLKLWDLSTQHCIQTVVAHRAEVWTLDVDPRQELIFTGSGEGDMKVWRFDHEAMRSGIQETDSGEVWI